MIYYKKKLHRVNFEEVIIDTKLENNHYSIGERVNGEVEVKSGSEDVSLGYVYIYLKTECAINPLKPLEKTEVLLDKFVVSQPLTLKANQTVHLPFSFLIPFHTPITYRSVKVFLHTGLDLHAGDDPEDIDFIEVGPSTIQERIFTKIKDFQFKEGRTKYIKTKQNQFVQVFNFINEDSLETLTLEFISSSFAETVLHIKYDNTVVNKEIVISVNVADTEDILKAKLQTIFNNY
ncbi:sporulation protein [Neobacillus niacini]|uniref:sporulation protein n=1 Tax=Neobacillus niacini TaxID=86668 RepID=UPI003983A29D